MTSPAIAASPSCPSPETVVAGAVSLSPEVSLASAEEAGARADLMAERASRYPQIGLFGQLGLGDRQPLDQIRDDQIGASANLDITSFGRRRALINAAKETLAAARAGEEQALLDVAETALILYSDYLAALRIVGLQKGQVRAYQDEAASLDRRLKLGLVTRSDAGRIEARLQLAKSELTGAMFRRDDLRSQLTVFTGIDELCLDLPDYEAEQAVLPLETKARIAALSLEEAFSISRIAAPELARAKEEKEAAELRLRAARRAGLPTVSANAFVLGQYDDSTISFTDRWEREERFGFSFRQPLFAGGSLRAERARQRASVRAASSEVDRQQQFLAYRVERAVYGTKRLSDMVAQNRTALRSAKETLSLTQVEVSTGSKRVADLILANDDYVRAALSLVQAQTDQQREQVRLARSTNMITPLLPVR